MLAGLNALLLRYSKYARTARGVPDDSSVTTVLAARRGTHEQGFAYLEVETRRFPPREPGED